MFHRKKSDKDELLPCDKYVKKRSRPVFYIKKLSSLLLIYVKNVHSKQIRDLRAIIEIIYTSIWEICMMLTS